MATATRPRVLTPAWLELAASPHAMADGAERERRALVNENTSGVRDRMDVLLLRHIIAIHAGIFPARHPAADALRSV